jgi:hypothetical protein
MLVLQILIIVAPTVFLAIRYRTEFRSGISDAKGLSYFAAIAAMLALLAYVVAYSMTDAFSGYHGRRRELILYMLAPVSFAVAAFPKAAAEYFDGYVDIVINDLYVYVFLSGWLGVGLSCLAIAANYGGGRG